MNMTRRILSALLSLGLIAGALIAAAPAKAQGTADPAGTKFFLRSTGCSSAGGNFDYLAIEDADEEIECYYTGAGFRYDVGEASGQTVEVPTPVGTQRPIAKRSDATRYFDSEGVSVVLDATKPVTGQIFTSGGSCVGTTATCIPGGGSMGEVKIEYTLVGTSGGTAVELGTQSETFQAAPQQTHLTELNIQPDPSHNGKTFELIDLQIWVHGNSVGHGVINTNGETSSFFAVPTASGDAKPDKPKPPGKNDPPGKGKKKGCGKGKGKKKGACPEPVPAACAAFTPGDLGKDLPVVAVTDAATEAAPVEVEVSLDASVANYNVIGGPTATGPGAGHASYFNVQVDSANPDAGLYAFVEFPERRDYDLNVFHPDGSYAARSRGNNTFIGTPAEGQLSAPGHGGNPTTSSENIVGLKTADCGGWTMDMESWFAEGGDFKVTLWLGEAKTVAQEAGAETP
jgi:hypothetical protein